MNQVAETDQWSVSGKAQNIIKVYQIFQYFDYDMVDDILTHMIHIRP